jgi:beta-galactosidase/beta-glucuronidase
MIVVRPDEAAWTVTCVACAHAGAPAGIVGRALPATVPGCVHLDLVRAGVIPPVDEGDGEARQEWVGHADWEWRGTVALDAAALAHARTDLAFGSIDTVAEVFVNGTAVGTSLDQFLPARVARARTRCACACARPCRTCAPRRRAWVRAR